MISSMLQLSAISAISAILFCIYGVQSWSNCGYEEFMEYELEHHPEISDSLAELEEYWHIFEEENHFRRRLAIDDNAITSKAFKGILDIPVIIHVLYNTNYQRTLPDATKSTPINTNQVISNERITSQLLRLNIDYLGFNDKVIPNGWDTLKANYSMSFKLHKIIRKQASVNEYSGDNEQKMFQDSPAIDRDHYLNIYVVPMPEGSLGFASPPGFPATEDAAVMNYDAFGDITFDYDNRWSTFQSNVDKGRTTTHEVGHWLFLKHIFGGAAGVNSCTDTDEVNDTPNQQEATNGCPTNILESCGSKDMFMNYMDYSDDECMSLFTKGQLLRSISILERDSSQNGRKGLVEYKSVQSNTPISYVNHIYFRVFTQDPSDKSNVCGPLDILMDVIPINTEISGKYIYGCYTTTNNKYVDVITEFVVNKNIPKIGYYCMETNLYKSNDPRYLCYRKGGFTDNSRIQSVTNNQIKNLFNSGTTPVKEPTASPTKAPIQPSNTNPSPSKAPTNAGLPTITTTPPPTTTTTTFTF